MQNSRNLMFAFGLFNRYQSLRAQAILGASVWMMVAGRNRFRDMNSHVGGRGLGKIAIGLNSPGGQIQGAGAKQHHYSNDAEAIAE